MKKSLVALNAALAALALAFVSTTEASAEINGFDIPTDGLSSPMYGAQPFTQKLALFEEFGTQPMPTTNSCVGCAPLPPAANCISGPNGAALDTFLRQTLYPLPTREANQSGPNYWATMVGACVRPLATSSMEGRPPGEWFAHQRWGEFYPEVYFQSAQAAARVNNGLRDAWQRHHYNQGEFRRNGGLYWNNGTTRGTQVRFHPNMPIQGPSAVWTFDGTLPPKLLIARYGEPVLFRHYNALPVNPAANGGFGANTITTHNHNGHNGAESDGFAAAFFFPGQYYDYHWPMVLAGHDTVNTGATDNRAGAPDGAGGITRVAGDYRETMSTHWFHDHMLDNTAQNVYKGNAAMLNIYSAIDRGREGQRCNYSNANNPNLCLPSGTALDWGNRDYDVNLLFADKAWNQSGQLWFNLFETDGFLGDRVLVNWQWSPYMEVRARRYRFRILNGAVSRFFKFAVVTEAGQRVPFHMVANDGNIMQHAVRFPNGESQDLPSIAIAERYDIVIDFAQFAPGTKIRVINLLEHTDPRGPNREIPLADVLSGAYQGDPAVGPVLEFRVVAATTVDRSMNPTMYEEGGRQMVPLPTVTQAEIDGARRRTFEFGRDGTDDNPWTIRTDGNIGLGMDPHRADATPIVNRWEVWELKSGGGWAHPVHVHFEEGRVLTRDGVAPPAWERLARKDVYRIGEGPDNTQEVEVLVRFREFLGTYMEHCHNTLHEDHSMRLDGRPPPSSIARSCCSHEPSHTRKHSDSPAVRNARSAVSK